MASSTNVKALLTEFFGTFFIIFISCWSYSSLNSEDTSWFGVGLANGLALAACAWAGISSSGAHFNPVITFIKLGTKNISIGIAAFYLLVQLFASVIASMCVIAITPSEMQPDDSQMLFYPKPDPSSTQFQIFIVEFIGSCLLVFTYFALIIDKRAPTNIFGFGLGAIILASSLAFGPFSGACINPLRVFGPELVLGTFAYSETFGFANFAGGIFAGFYYEFFLLKNDEFSFIEEEEDASLNMKTAENVNQALSLKY